MGHRATQKDKAARALLAGFDLLDTADWFAGEVRGALASFDLTIAGFRLMEMLLREGGTSMSLAARGRGLDPQNLNVDRGELGATRMGAANAGEASSGGDEGEPFVQGQTGTAEEG